MTDEGAGAAWGDDAPHEYEVPEVRRAPLPDWWWNQRLRTRQTIAASILIALVFGALPAGSPLEVGQHHLVRLMQDVGQHVQAAAVGHADDHLFYAKATSRFDERIEQW